MITPTSKYIKLMGYKRFHYTHWGRNSTFKIILLHGIGESSNIWFQLAPLLANKYEVIALDLRGHGGTPWDTEGDYSLNEITFGKGKGYLNSGIRWAMSPNLMLEINFNDINQNTNSEYTNREIKVMYSESF